MLTLCVTLGIMRFLSFLLLLTIVASLLYLFVPIERMHLRAKDTIQKAQPSDPFATVQEAASKLNDAVSKYESASSSEGVESESADRAAPASEDVSHDDLGVDANSRLPAE